MSEPYIGPFTCCLSRTHSVCNEFSKCETKTLKAKRKKKDKKYPLSRDGQYERLLYTVFFKNEYLAG